MERVDLNGKYETEKSCLIMIFTEGTVLGPKSFFDFFNQKKYCPIKSCITKIKNWEEQGAEIVYLTSRRKRVLVEQTRDLLKHYGFSGSFVYARSEKDRYKDIVESVCPRVLIEDDCKSIGGNWQIAIKQVAEPIKKNITSIIVNEFGGIDYLPNDLNELVKYNK